MLLAFFSFWPDFAAGLIAIARSLAPVRLICSCKLRLRRGKPDGRLTQRRSSSS